MNKYLEYKDSGFEWTGPIPIQWTLQRVAQVFSERKEKVDDKTFPPLSVTMSGVVDQLPDVAKTDHSDNRKLVKKGDFVINSRSDRKGSSGISPRDGSVSVINIVMEPRNESAPSFYEYLFKSFYFKEEFFRNGKGIVWDLWSTKWDQMKIILLPVPPEKEQNLISKYLDKKTSQIDSLIEKIQQKIELLKEQRISLISHCVTKGLNPDVEMKDSGVEWIGEIPSHWNSVPIKYVTTILSGSTPKSKVEEYWNGSINWYTPSDLESESIKYLAQSKRKITELGLKSCGCIYVKADSLILSTRAPVGKVGISKVDFATSQGCKSLCVSENLDLNFLYYHLSVNTDTLNSISNGTTFLELSTDHLSGFPVVLPPRNEQNTISCYLDKRTSKIDSLIEKETKRIELLKEYRQSLISNVVTGKVRITEGMI